MTRRGRSRVGRSAAQTVIADAAGGVKKADNREPILRGSLKAAGSTPRVVTRKQRGSKTHEFGSNTQEARHTEFRGSKTHRIQRNDEEARHTEFHRGSKTHRIRWVEGGRGRGSSQRRTGLGDAVGGDKAWEKPCGSECGADGDRGRGWGCQEGRQSRADSAGQSQGGGVNAPGRHVNSSERAAGERGSAKISRQKLTP